MARRGVPGMRALDGEDLAPRPRGGGGLPARDLPASAGHDDEGSDAPAAPGGSAAPPPEGRGSRGAVLSGVLALLAAAALAAGVADDGAEPRAPAADGASTSARDGGAEADRETVGPAPDPVEVDTAALAAPALDEPGWLPGGIEWRGPARYPGASGVRAYVLRTPGPDPRSSTLLLQTATSPDGLPPPYGASTVVAVAGRPASLVRTFAGGRELRWSDSRGAFRLQAGAGSGGPADATLVAVAAGVSDPRGAPAGAAVALPRDLPPGARRLPDVETQVAGYQPAGSTVRAWEVGTTRLLYRVEPGEEPLRSRRFDAAVQELDVDGVPVVLATSELRDRPREVRWNADGRAFHLTVSDPAPAPGEAGVTDEQLVEVVRSVG